MTSEAKRLLEAFHALASEANAQLNTTHVFARAGLRYEEGRAALRELEMLGVLREEGNLG